MFQTCNFHSSGWERVKLWVKRGWTPHRSLRQANNLPTEAMVCTARWYDERQAKAFVAQVVSPSLPQGGSGAFCGPLAGVAPGASERLDKAVQDHRT